MKNNRVLIVDDEIITLSMLKLTLTKAGYEVTATSRSKEAAGLAKEHLPFVILLDIQMPEFDGFDVGQALRAEQETRNIPIIYLSSLIPPGQEVFTIEKGGLSFMAKPFRRDKLLTEVRRHYQEADP
jgi:CheY-like chemotaxis protein